MDPGGAVKPADGLNRRQALPQGRITRTQSDNVSYGTHQKEYYEIGSVDISTWRIHKDENGKAYAAYVIIVTMKSGMFVWTSRQRFSQWDCQK